MYVVNAAAGVAVRVDIAQENFSGSIIVRPVIPGSAGVQLGVSPATMCAGRHRCGHRVLPRNVIEDSLAGITANGALPGSHLVESLRTQHYLATHALVIADLGKIGRASCRERV